MKSEFMLLDTENKLSANHLFHPRVGLCPPDPFLMDHQETANEKVERRPARTAGSASILRRVGTSLDT